MVFASSGMRSSTTRRLGSRRPDTAIDDVSMMRANWIRKSVSRPQGVLALSDRNPLDSRWTVAGQRALSLSLSLSLPLDLRLRLDLRDQIIPPR